MLTLLEPTQFIVIKQGEEAQKGPAEYLAASAIMPTSVKLHVSIGK